MLGHTKTTEFLRKYTGNSTTFFKQETSCRCDDVIGSVIHLTTVLYFDTESKGFMADCELRLTHTSSRAAAGLRIADVSASVN